MTFDISLEAIEADFALAERSPGGTLERLALARAHVRAILLASGLDVALRVDQTMDSFMVEPVGVTPATEAQADAAAEVAGTIIDGPTEPEDDVDVDFFAEAKKERGR